MNKIQRICCVCRTKQAVSAMIRVVRVGEIYLIEDQKRLNGRGCYVCPTCCAAAVAKKALNRSFRAPVAESVYKQLATRCPNAKIN